MKSVLAAVALALTLTATAEAATWRQVTATGGSSIDQVGHVRTADGVLHVVWHKGGDLFHTAIGANGRVGATTPIQTGWTGHQDAAIVSVPGGLRVLWGALRSTDSSDPQRELNTAFSSDGGVSWQLQPGSVVPDGGQAYGSDVSATTLPDGTTLQAWAGTLGTWVHSGLSPETPITNFQAALGNYGNYPGLAASANGQAMMAWFSSAEGHRGVLAQGVNADGTPAGQLWTMPGSQVMVGGGTVARTPIAARAKNGGFYVAYGLGYPSANRVVLWKVGSSHALELARTKADTQVAVAADPKGRLWVVWTDGTFGSPRVYAARSNRAASTFGARVDLGAVRDANQAYALDANATASGVDVLALFGIGTSPGGSTYVTRAQPGLTLTAARGTFTVTDAGEPVKGARVKVGGRSGRTNAKGKVKLGVRRGTATASAPGYASAKLRLK